MIRREKAVRGGPTYPDYHHIHLSWPSSDDALDEGFLAFCEQERERTPGGKLIVHLGLHSMTDFLVVESDDAR